MDRLPGVDGLLVQPAGPVRRAHQGTAEHAAFTRQKMDQMIDLAAAGIRQLYAIQRTAIEAPAGE